MRIENLAGAVGADLELIIYPASDGLVLVINDEKGARCRVWIPERRDTRCEWTSADGPAEGGRASGTTGPRKRQASSADET